MIELIEMIKASMSCFFVKNKEVAWSLKYSLRLIKHMENNSLVHPLSPQLERKLTDNLATKLNIPGQLAIKKDPYKKIGYSTIDNNIDSNEKQEDTLPNISFNNSETFISLSNLTLDYGSLGQYSIAVDLPASGPSNDHFINRSDLGSAENTTVTGTNVLATGETDEPPQSGTINSVWWKWTAPNDGTVVIDTYGSPLDTYLSPEFDIRK